MMRRLIQRATLLALALAGAASAPAGAAEQHAGAIKNYNTYCVQCHGVNRDGNGINSKDMSVKPRDHTDSKAMGDTPDETLFKAVKGGGLAVSKSVLMPKWEGILNDDEIREMVAYLRFVSNTQSK